MAEVTKGSESNKKAPKYDPQKAYQWQPEDRFLLSGMEFAQLYQAIKADVHLSGGIPAKQKVEVFEMLERVVGAAVEAGVAVEIVEQPKDVSILPKEGFPPFPPLSPNENKN